MSRQAKSEELGVAMQLIISPQRGEEYKKQELQVVRFLFFVVRSRNYHLNFCTCLTSGYTIEVEKPCFAEKKMLRTN